MAEVQQQKNAAEDGEKVKELEKALGMERTRRQEMEKILSEKQKQEELEKVAAAEKARKEMMTEKAIHERLSAKVKVFIRFFCDFFTLHFGTLIDTYYLQKGVWCAYNQ